MTFIKQVEQSLKAIDQSRFQSFIYHLLQIQGYTFIGAPGSVIGKEKTRKGTPDAFFFNEGMYTFVECTTKERIEKSKSFVEKLESDIEHCFNETKSKISNEQIGLVVLAFTEDVTPEEDNKLRVKIREFSKTAELKLLNIQNLPTEIYGIPGLADQYLGEKLLKGEIYNLPDFLQKTTRGIQPSLTNAFLGRENEIKESESILKNQDILLLTGHQGVGKSKLAVALLESFQKKKYLPIVILSSAIPLVDDLAHLFQSQKNYIILFDDANKAPQNLVYLLNYITRASVGKVKVIITVRDYAKDTIYRCLSEADILYRELLLKKHQDKEIETVICNV